MLLFNIHYDLDTLSLRVRAGFNIIYPYQYTTYVGLLEQAHKHPKHVLTPLYQSLLWAIFDPAGA